MHAPGLANYVNRLVSGKDLSEGGHWAAYAANKFVKPLADKRASTGQDLSMVSIGCGDGHIEQALINDFDWPVSSFRGLEYDSELRRVAAERFSRIHLDCSFDFLDFNAPPLVTEQFDVVFTCHRFTMRPISKHSSHT